MKKIVLILLMSLLAIFLCLYGFYYFNFKKGEAWPSHADPKVVGYVPDEETAIKIAEVLWLPLYGDAIYDHKPFKASLKDSIWVIRGTIVKGARGGVPCAEIQKKDCKVVRVYHTK